MFRPPPECPACGRSLRNEQGLDVRELDRDFDTLKTELHETALRRIKKSAIVILVLGLLNSAGAAIPIVNVPLIIVIVIAHFFCSRFLVCAPYAKHFGFTRRVVTRWLSRMFVLFMAGFHTGGVVPVVAPLVSPVVYLATAGTVWWYHRFHLEREHRREPVTILEKLFLIVAVLLVLALFALLMIFSTSIAELMRPATDGG